jgi:hypothetical protein
VRHLLQQIESDRANRIPRDVRPTWIVQLIEETADLFEPLAGVGRVGYDCRVDEEGWQIDMFLGAIEVLGGREDGQTRSPEFRFDIQPLLDRFTHVTDLSWNVYAPQAAAEDLVSETPRSFLSIDGLIDGQRVRISVLATPPAAAGPGLRSLPGGRIETV